MLEIKNVFKSYKPKKGTIVKALQNINLKFPNTGMIFILGKSGSGKSTLLNIIGGLDKQTEGEILLNNYFISKKKNADSNCYRNNYVSFIFQDYNLIEEYNVYKNIELSSTLQNSKLQKSDIDIILKKVGLNNKGNRKPNELSGGEKQRVAIARAIARNSKIVLADEPTGNLDTNTSDQIFSLLKETSKEKLVIVVTHDIESAKRYANRIIQLQDGLIVYDNNTNDIIVDNNKVNISRSYFSIKNKLSLSFTAVKKKKFKLSLAIVSMILSLILFGVSHMLTYFNIPYTHAKSLVDNKETRLEVYKKNDGNWYSPESLVTSYTDTDTANINTFFKKYDINLSKISTIISDNQSLKITLNTDIKFEEKHKDHAYYKMDIMSLLFAEYNVDLKLQILGEFPKQSNEVLISKFLADYIIHFGIIDYEYNEDKELIPIVTNFKSYEDILTSNYEMKLSNINFKIVGIIDEDLSQYEQFKTTSESKLLAEKNKIYKEFIRRYQRETYIYVAPSFFTDNAFSKNIDMAYTLYNVNLLKNNEKIFLDNLSLARVSKEIKVFDGKNEVKINKLNDNEIIINASYLNKIDSTFSDNLFAYLKKEKSNYEAKVKHREEQITKQQLELEKNPNLFFEIIPEIPMINLEKLQTEYIKKYLVENNIIDSLITIQFNDLYSRLDRGNTITYENVKIIGYSLAGANSSLYSYLSDNIINNYVIPVFNTAYTYFYDDDIKKIESILKELPREYKQYDINTIYSNSMNDISKIVNKLSGIFKYVSIGVLLFTCLIGFNFMMTAITDNKKNIGILRALGTSKKNVFEIFILEDLIIGIISILVSVPLLLILINYFNSLISKDLFFTAQVLIFRIETLYIMIGVVLLIMVASTIVPLIKFLKMKPIDLIYNKK